MFFIYAFVSFFTESKRARSVRPLSSGKKVGRSGKKVGERRGADRSRVVILIRSIEKCHIHKPRRLLLQVG